MKYFAGEPSNLGQVYALPQRTFAQLCELLREPVALELTRKEFHDLPLRSKNDGAQSQELVKCVRFITAATFKTDPSARRTEFAVKCNLVFLDIDDSEDAKALLAQRWDALGQLGYLVWHTASSTALKPRLRIMVAADGIPVKSYPDAVRSVAELLALPNITSESRVAVQPMYFPVDFDGEEGGAGPIIACNPDGDALSIDDLIEAPAKSEHTLKNLEPRDDDEIQDIAFLSSRIDGMTQELASEILSHLDPDCGMQQWIEIGAGLKHQFGDDGFELWDTWSQKGTKYAEADDIRYRWDSLKENPIDRQPVTMRSVVKLASTRGWSNLTLAQRGYKDVTEWLQEGGRSTEELIDLGVNKIAALGATITSLQRRTLMNRLRARISQGGISISLGDLMKELRKAERETLKHAEQPAWAKGMSYVSALNVFYRETNDRKFTPEVLDLMYSMPAQGDEKTMRPRDYLIQIVQVPQVENTRYDPAQANQRLIYDGQVPYINTYRGPTIASDPERAAEAGDVFQEHVANLIREPAYQRTLIDFCAYHVQHPGRKIRWSILLQGAQGCGKTAIAVAMTTVLGRRNVRKLTATNVLDGQHNDWAYGSQLVVMEEVRVIGQNRHGVMDKLKPCISDDEISLHCKYESVRTVPNVTNYMMFTNHHDALAINDSDRRYFVLASPLQDPAAIEALGGEKYFDRLFGMIENNPGGLRSFFETWPISANFGAQTRAPVTPYMKELAHASATPLNLAVINCIADQPNPLVRADLLSMTALRHALDASSLGNFSDQGLAGVLRELGYTRAGRSLLDDGQRHSLWTKNFPAGLDSRVAANERFALL